MVECIGRINDGIYNCFGVFDRRMCYDCIYNSKSNKEKKVNRFVDYRYRIDELYKFLKGEELPKGTNCKMPKLSPDMAFTVIWFLQEHLHVLPDNIEQCEGCKDLFDTESSGYYLDDQYELNGKTLPKKHWGHWCDGCVPSVDFKLK